MSIEKSEMYLGIDVGSVSTKMVVLSAATLDLVDSLYIRTHGDSLGSIQTVMHRLAQMQPRPKVKASATTGSGRTLAARLINAVMVKNEITTHTLAAVKIQPGVRTIVEIGGQDSKIIIVRDGRPVDFAMNTVCAAGTGSFLDQQASRLGIQVEDMSELALASDNPAPSLTAKIISFARG